MKNTEIQSLKAKVKELEKTVKTSEAKGKKYDMIIQKRVSSEAKVKEKEDAAQLKTH